MVPNFWGRIVGISVGLSLAAGPAYAASQEFFHGKSVRIIVGLTAGGGFDAYARLIARHIGRHIPGNPTFIVENMPGGGSMVAANYVYKLATPDGLTIGHVSGNIFLNQLGERL